MVRELEGSQNAVTPATRFLACSPSQQQRPARKDVLAKDGKVIEMALSRFTRMNHLEKV